MAVIHPSIFHVMKRFPGRKERITGLFNQDEAFRSICEDYKQCLDVISYWSGDDSDEAVQRKVEYEDLLRGLESEIELLLRS